MRAGYEWSVCLGSCSPVFLFRSSLIKQDVKGGIPHLVSSHATLLLVLLLLMGTGGCQRLGRRMLPGFRDIILGHSACVYSWLTWLVIYFRWSWSLNCSVGLWSTCQRFTESLDRDHRRLRRVHARLTPSRITDLQRRSARHHRHERTRRGVHLSTHLTSPN